MSYLKDILVHFLRQWSAGSPSTKELVVLGFAYKPIWAVVRAGWVELWSSGDDLKWRRKAGTHDSGCFVQ